MCAHSCSKGRRLGAHQLPVCPQPAGMTRLRARNHPRPTHAPMYSVPRWQRLDPYTKSGPSPSRGVTPAPRWMARRQLWGATPGQRAHDGKKGSTPRALGDRARLLLVIVGSRGHVMLAAGSRTSQLLFFFFRPASAVNNEGCQ